MRRRGEPQHRVAPEPRRRFGARSGASTDTSPGVVLITCVVILAVLIAGGAASLWLVRSELWAAGSARAARQARYSAEAGIWHALAAIAPGASFDALLAGSGGLADPARPGPLPFVGGGWVEFPGPPFGYAVTIAAEPPTEDGAPRIRLESTATAVRQARRRVDAVVARAKTPYTPAALVVDSGRLALSGHAVGVASAPGVQIDARSVTGRGIAALAAATEEALAAALAASQAAFVALEGNPVHGIARPFTLSAFVAESGLAIQLLSGVVSLETAPGAVLRVVGGVLPRLAGRGLLVADGDLRVLGETDFEGVLLVGGRLRLEGAPCRIAGMVRANEVELTTACGFLFDAGLVDEVDRTIRLPRLPVLLSLADAEVR